MAGLYLHWHLHWLAPSYGQGERLTGAPARSARKVALPQQKKFEGF